MQSPKTFSDTARRKMFSVLARIPNAKQNMERCQEFVEICARSRLTEQQVIELLISIAEDWSELGTIQDFRERLGRFENGGKGRQLGCQRCVGGWVYTDRKVSRPGGEVVVTGVAPCATCQPEHWSRKQQRKLEERGVLKESPMEPVGAVQDRLGELHR